MDPEAATDAMKEIVLALEKSLQVYPWPPGYADELRDLRQEGYDIQEDMQDWQSSGGFRDRRWPTWDYRFTNVLVEQRRKGGI